MMRQFRKMLPVIYYCRYSVTFATNRSSARNQMRSRSLQSSSIFHISNNQIDHVYVLQERNVTSDELSLYKLAFIQTQSSDVAIIAFYTYLMENNRIEKSN